MTSTKLQKVEPAHDKEQDAITINWRSNWQAQEHEILKQTRPYLEIQQCMNQERRWIEDSIFNKQWAIWTKSDIFQVMQLTRNVPKDDEQHIQRTSTWRSVKKLHGWLCYICKNQEGTGGKNSMILKDSRET